MNSSFSFESSWWNPSYYSKLSQAKQLARQGTEQSSPPTHKKSDDLCLFFCIYPSSMVWLIYDSSYPLYLSQALDGMLGGTVNRESRISVHTRHAGHHQHAARPALQQRQARLRHTQSAHQVHLTNRVLARMVSCSITWLCNSKLLINYRTNIFCNCYRKFSWELHLHCSLG